MIFFFKKFPNMQLIKSYFPAKSMVKSKNDSSNDPKASTDSSTTLEDDDSKGRTSQGITLLSSSVRSLRNIKKVPPDPPASCYWIVNHPVLCVQCYQRTL